MEAGEKAILRGVTVDVISIIGSECSIENLSIVTEATGGSVDRVDPQALMQPGYSKHSIFYNIHIHILTYI